MYRSENAEVRPSPEGKRSRNERRRLSTTSNFGGTARFALAAGAAYSSLGTRTFERVHGFARDREGAIVIAEGTEVSGQIVEIDEESDQRIGPLLILHTREGNWKLGAAVTYRFEVGKKKE